MSAPSGLRGLPLLDEGIRRIEADPSSWFKQHYRCESGMCLFGHIAEIDGGEWAFGADEDGRAYYLVPRDDDPVDDVGEVRGKRVVECWDRVARLLGFSAGACCDLEDGHNSLAGIKALRDRIAAGDLS